VALTVLQWQTSSSYSMNTLRPTYALLSNILYLKIKLLCFSASFIGWLFQEAATFFVRLTGCSESGVPGLNISQVQENYIHSLIDKFQRIEKERIQEVLGSREGKTE